MGRSWTRVNPDLTQDYREVAGLPDQNTGRFVTEGQLKNISGVSTRTAIPLHGNSGGLDEILVPDPEEQIEIERISGVNPNF